jgi:DNA-binding FadR family transcriptional regulator
MRPLYRPRKLSQEVAARITAYISREKLPIGSRLPTEEQFKTALGVSRTALREAIAVLRGEGLISTQQGLGAFVAADVSSRQFKLDGDQLKSVAIALEVMELRASVEVESAYLAAKRGSAASHRKIGSALAALERTIRRGESAIREDFEFHRAISLATGNQQFTRFLDYLGQFIIPRQSIRIGHQGQSDQRAYLEQIQAEHRAICDAIQSGDADGARRAMWEHLTNSRERYRRLAATLQKEKRGNGARRKAVN